MSTVNAIYTFGRKRHYRLFETSVDSVLSTPSAHQVRVDSSPVSSSPLQFLASIIGTDNAQARAHPDPARDVWEVAVWDPVPICLRLFCYFSPGHVLIYWLFLPTSPVDPRPSMTVATAIFVAFLLSVQLSWLQSSFSQQEKDTALISKEVLHEYDTKFVHPRTQPLYRDVATQFTEQASYNPTRDAKYNVVETYKPMFVVNRGFKPNPNPNYLNHTDPVGIARQQVQQRAPVSTPSVISHTQTLRTPANFSDSSSPLRPNTAIRQPNFRPSMGTSDGGSLGVYSHAASPLRKSASINFDVRGQYSNEYARERAGHSPQKSTQSPNKRLSISATGFSTLEATQRRHNTKSGAGRRESGQF